uniref:thioredoxin-2-like n=1 Tax=Ciona intestinalis TaxID=7719 RepID=UPI000180C768|nr:thioredoxin-2-like [Ciona intestinalis]|eukprot:XP_004225624.1 thioredoxin-2-like [Ciona intestinalis]
MVIAIANKEEFENQLATAGSKLVVLDFFADWCWPCREIAPKYEKIAGENSEQAVFLKVDVTVDQTLAYKYKVTGLPTFIFFKHGENIKSFSGADEDQLRSNIETLK